MKKKLIFFNEKGAYETIFEYIRPTVLMEMARKAKETDGILLDCLKVCYCQRSVKDFVYQLDNLCFVISCVGGFQDEELEDIVTDDLMNIFFEPIFENQKYFETHKKLIMTLKELDKGVF